MTRKGLIRRKTKQPTNQKNKKTKNKKQNKKLFTSNQIKKNLHRQQETEKTKR